jgi:hypothetical protein
MSGASFYKDGGGQVYADDSAETILTKLKTVDGAGSGLDADLLDGQSGAYYLALQNATGQFQNNVNVIGNIELLNGADRQIVIGSSTNYNYALRAVGDDFQILEAGTTARLTIKYPNGNVGIGTDSPQAKTHISFSPPASIPALGSGSAALAVGPAAAYGMLAGTISNGTGYIQQQRFDGTNTVYPIALQPNGGFVGVGTALPNAKLELVNNGTNLRLNTTFVGGNSVDINPYVEGISNAGFSITVGSNIRQVINASGDVGIGVSNPTVRLDARTNNPARGIISLVRNDSLSGQTGAQMQISQAGISDWAFGQPAGAAAFAFWVGRNPTADGAEVMRLKSTGSVRFIPLASAPASPEAGDVYYDSTTNKLRCYNGTTWNDLF